MKPTRNHGQELVLRRSGMAANTGTGGLLDLIDRPLRYAAGEDVVLLRIYRGAVVGSAAAALGALVLGAVF